MGKVVLAPNIGIQQASERTNLLNTGRKRCTIRTGSPTCSSLIASTLQDASANASACAFSLLPIASQKKSFEKSTLSSTKEFSSVERRWFTRGLCVSRVVVYGVCPSHRSVWDTNTQRASINSSPTPASHVRVSTKKRVVTAACARRSTMI